MSADGPARPVEQEVPRAPDNGSSQGDDGPDHTAMEDIDAADSFRGDVEGDRDSDDASHGPEMPVIGETEEPKGEADDDGAPAEPIDSEYPDHEEAGHAAAGDMDALGDADDDARKGHVWDYPLASEDLLSDPADDGSAIGGDLDEQGGPGKPSAETAVAVEGSSPPEMAGDEEPTAQEEARDTAPRDAPAEHSGPDDGSAAVRGRDDSAEDPRPEQTPTAGEQVAPGEAPERQGDSALTSREAGEQAEPPAIDTGGHRDDLTGGHGTGEHEDHTGDHSGGQKDDGEAEGANEPDASSEEDGEAGDPKSGDRSENPLADVAEALGERYPEVASVITKLGADDANRLNVIENLKDPEGGGERTLEIVQELAVGETLEGRSLEEYRSENPGRGPLFEPVEHEVNHAPDGTSRKNAYVEQTKVDDSVRALGAAIEDSDRAALDDYGMRLQNEVEPAVYEDVMSLLEEAGCADDAELSIRTKSADGLVDKVKRMTEGSEGRKARPDYEIGDVIDAVGARITVDDTARLEAVLEKAKEHFGIGEDGRLLEVENMYAQPKSGNPSYRVIPMVAAIEVGGKPYTYELQLTTKRASVAADLEHNTVYKPHIETTSEERDVMRKMQAEAAALDQEETRRRYP
ncbi:hypothetical protein [Streptomyces sp. SAJ15]|uniref:hypothetical protein n=1 Tax=Streptomyces sp. SAJ15 TaxID=2011095 RepID=UPI0021B43DB4|nr:hypothetical protein [Streptomyces sp. SAJ15]